MSLNAESNFFRGFGNFSKTYLSILYIDLTEKSINMTGDCEVDTANKQVQLCVIVERNESCELYLHAQHWIINKTGLPLQMKASLFGCYINIFIFAIARL